MSAAPGVGFSQRIRFEWLELTAARQAAGLGREAIAADLDARLRTEVSVGSTARKGNRSKAIGNLLRVWVTVPAERRPFRDEGLAHWARLPLDQHLAIQWGAVIAAYPFVAQIAGTVGRLLSLQDAVSAGQIHRRLAEQLGQRSTVERATQRVLRNFLDWDVLGETSRPGLYHAPGQRPVTDQSLTWWLLEAILHSSGAPASSIADMLASPILFPFGLTHARMSRSGVPSRVEIHSQGLDREVLMLR